MEIFNITICNFIILLVENFIVLIFANFALESCSKLENIDTKEVKDDTYIYSGVKSKKEYFDLIKTNICPFNKLTKEELVSFGDELIFIENNYPGGITTSMIESLNEEDYYAFFHLVFKENPYSYKGSEYNSQKVNEYGEPQYPTPIWLIHKSPRLNSTGHTCVSSHDDWCLQPIKRFIPIIHN